MPSPARYAVHKLIISRRRREGAAKRDKDVQQADALPRVLADARPHDLKQAWDEAHSRGPRWRQLHSEGLSEVNGFTRDLTLKTVGALRSSLPGLDLTFNNPPVRYDFSRDVVAFSGEAVGKTVPCAIGGPALVSLNRTDLREAMRQHQVPSLQESLCASVSHVEKRSR
ncbi:hypothetical protein FFI89_029270 [Bradyrhizobium sp. KBS0727]|nr:hypothetical protein FFI71_029275 [Bradyrhizobium sp. KBS0725]QDW47463.1 hypothetical protein FFI89_029270 [Bradyrhizobium sp. KBS0727]